MRARVFVILIVVLVFVVSTAGATSIGIFADPVPYGTFPFIDEAPPTYTLYIIVTNTNELTAVQFAAPLPDCMANATLISETASPPNLKIGSIETGAGVARAAYGDVASGEHRNARLAASER